MKPTEQAILDTAQELIQTRGYSAISYQDIAERVGIAKPSIHHHFPTKAALVQAVVARYRTNFKQALDAALADESRSAHELLKTYASPYRQFAGTGQQVCLCGALAGEFPALPPEVRAEVAGFFDDHLAWLKLVLARRSPGRRGSEARAALLLAALQGMLMVRRATGDPRIESAVIGEIKHLIDRDAT